jgi:hypothetical protein
MTRPLRHGVLLLGAMCVCLPATVSAQVPYVFTRIADTVQNPGTGLDGVSCIAMNGYGHLVVKTSTGALMQGSGGAFTMVVPTSGSLCPSINDLGEIAYIRPGPGPGVSSLVRNAGGIETTLARTDVAPHLSSSPLTPINESGKVAYVSSSLAGFGIYLVPGPIKVYDAAVDPPLTFASPATLNDSDVTVFAATNAGVPGLYRGSLIPFLESGDAVAGGVIVFSSLQRPVINASGRVAFEGRLDVGGIPGIGGLYTTADGSSVSLVGSVPIAGSQFSMNDAGTVAYRLTTTAGVGSGVFIGRPGAINQKIINVGDPIDGSTLLDAFVWAESLNNNGQIAFWAQLADGRRGVYRADPQWLKTLSFTAKFPACGPVNGKVTLRAAAPVGGLLVALNDNNPAANVPLNVHVPQGKTSATFQITPTPVFVKTLGNVDASALGQTLTRALTILPISVKTMTLAPLTVVGGTPVGGTVTLNCAAPHDITVALTGSKPLVGRPDVPSLFFPAGATSLPFGVTTFPVAALTSSTIKASAYGITKSKKLTVTP